MADIGAVITFMRGVPNTLLDAAILVFSAGVAAIASVAVAMLFTLLRTSQTLKASDGVLGTHEYMLQDDGLFERTSVNETLAKWKSVKGAFRAGRFLFIELSQGSFHIVPVAAFASEDEQLRFYSEVKARAQSDA